MLPSVPEGKAPEQEVAEEEQADAAAVDILVRREYLAMRYRDMLAEGQHLRFLHRRVLAAEKRPCLEPEGVLEAAGGLERITEEAQMNHGAGTGSLAPAHVGDCLSGGQGAAGGKDRAALDNLNHLLALPHARPRARAPRRLPQRLPIARRGCRCQKT